MNSLAAISKTTSSGMAVDSLFVPFVFFVAYPTSH